MNELEHWFIQKEECSQPTAVHWKGHLIQLLPLAVSAFFVALTFWKIHAGESLTRTFLGPSIGLCFAAFGTKYYFYHERTKS